MRRWINGLALFIGVLLVCVSCGDAEQKGAKNLVNEAQVSYQSGDYWKAQQLIDSLHAVYPKQIGRAHL